MHMHKVCCSQGLCRLLIDNYLTLAEEKKYYFMTQGVIPNNKGKIYMFGSQQKKLIQFAVNSRKALPDEKCEQ